MDTLLALAVLPAAALLYYIYKKDPVEKEPVRLLMTLLGFGVLSTIPAIVLEQMGSVALLSGVPQNSLTFLFVENFLVVAVVEEACKFFFLRLKTWNNPAFDYLFDAIVYAVFVSLGFAIAENISYVVEYGFGTAIVRAFTAIPGHCIFAVFMGYFYGLAKLADVQGNTAAKTLYLALSILVPVACHGFYDFWASIDGEFALMVFFVFLIGMVFIGFQLVKSESIQARRLHDQQ